MEKRFAHAYCLYADCLKNADNVVESSDVAGCDRDQCASGYEVEFLIRQLDRVSKLVHLLHVLHVGLLSM
jgi:hypothetical protein